MVTAEIVVKSTSMIVIPILVRMAADARILSMATPATVPMDGAEKDATLTSMTVQLIHAKMVQVAM